MPSLTTDGPQTAASTPPASGHPSLNGKPWLAQEPGLVARAGRTLRNRLPIVVALMALGGLLGVVLASAGGPSDRATASLLLAGPGSQRTTDTQRTLIELPRVAQATSRTLGGDPSAAEVAEAVTVRPRSGANVIAVEAAAGSADEAIRIADAYAEAAVGVARAAGARPPRLVQRAAGTVSSASYPLLAGLGFGLLGGLALGLALAVMLEKLDRRLKSSEELEQIYELPVLSRVPRSRALSRRSRRSVTDDPLKTASGFSQEAEAFRTLRANLRYFNVDKPVRSVLVVSPLSGDGKSTIARHLAITMAAMGDRVALVDADLRKRDAENNGLRAEGLSLVLAGFDLDESLTEVPVAFDPVSERSRSLMRLASGPLPPNPSELLESDRMRWVIKELERRFDAVIIDSPALVTVSDALSLVPAVSGVIVVGGIGHTTRNAALGLRKQLLLLGGRPLGVVGNFWSAAGDGYYYGYDRAAGKEES